MNIRKNNIIVQFKYSFRTNSQPKSLKKKDEFLLKIPTRSIVIVGNHETFLKSTQKMSEEELIKKINV